MTNEKANSKLKVVSDGELDEEGREFRQAMKPQWALEEIVDTAVAEQYDGPLERLGENKDGAICYRPEDTDRVRELLVSLWGEVLTPDAIEDAFERLMDHDEWPHGYCEEDTAIATGGAAAVLRAPTPAFIGAVFPSIAAADRHRISLLLAWAMQVQHTETSVELARARRRSAAEAFAQDVGFGDDRWQPFMSFIHSILQR